MNKKHIAIVAGASMLMLGVPAISMAQTAAASGPFADVPADHWAYTSVDTLQKAGIVIGYPDGTYGGKRAMTRYEFAVAIARLMPLLTPNLSDYATKEDLAAAQADLEQKLQANSDAITALQNLVNEFQPELEKLGQDVAAINDRLDALSARVAAVEEEQRRVKFNGALNIIAEGVDATEGGDDGFVYDQDGIPIGEDIGDTKHLLATTDVAHDFVLGITGRVSDTATANVMLDYGNYLAAIGNVDAPGYPAGGVFPTYDGYGTLDASDEQVTVWDANLQTPVSLGPLGGADLTVGRFGNQWTKYTLAEVDSDVYTRLYQTDSGNIPTDGVKAVLKLGPVGLNAWAGQFKAIPFAQPWGGATESEKYELPTGLEGLAKPLEQGAGARATIGSPDTWVLGASVEQFGAGDDEIGTGTDTGEGGSNGVLSVYGADFNGMLPFFQGAGLKLDLNWTDAAEGTDSSSFNNFANGWKFESTDDQLGFTVGGLALKGGYQYVGPYFTAPGYWGRVGGWINPTNIEGPVASAKYNFSPKVRLNADYEDWEAAYGEADGVSSPLESGPDGQDKLNRYQVGLGFDIASTFAVDLGYENDTFDLKNFDPKSVSPVQSYFTLGLGHEFNENASFKLEYQIAEYDDKGSGYATGDGAIADSTGNIAVGQFQLKF